MVLPSCIEYKIHNTWYKFFTKSKHKLGFQYKQTNILKLIIFVHGKCKMNEYKERLQK